MKTHEKISMAIHIFVGIGALAGGTAAITDPHNPMGMNAADALRFSPFDSFLIPGIILFAVIGMGNLFSAIVIIKNRKLKPFISGFFASALVIWIVVQCIMLQAIAALHVIFFCIGAVQGFLALYMLYKRSQI